MYDNFYHPRHRHEQATKRIQKCPILHPQNKQLIFEFSDFCVAEGLTLARAMKYMEL